ncbi:hypothetical protein SAMN04488595_11837 [Ralstonia sp. 25mfcol4.1]|nr:hypothetical protein SAMN04488595_11837 [Ralstonia sp. 25mfcol4.1]
MENYGMRDADRTAKRLPKRPNSDSSRPPKLFL